MRDKIWYKVKFDTDEQTVEIYPTETFDGIILEVKEFDGSNLSRLYLNQDEMELLVIKMTEMMKYLKSKQQEQ
jgi:hypothetical protein